jgi:hypothetical protein
MARISQTKEGLISPGHHQHQVPLEGLGANLSKEILAEAIRKFDDESKWKDQLDSKALSLLGFNAVFVALVATAFTLAERDTTSIADYFWFPILIQAISALLLLCAVRVGKIDLGPSVVDLYRERKNLGDDYVDEVARHYIGSLLENRVVYSTRLAFYQAAVLLTAVSIAQLTVGLLVFLWATSAEATIDTDPFKWIPGTSLIVVLGLWTAYSHYRSHESLKEELEKWNSYLEEEGGTDDGVEEGKDSP